MADNRPRQTGCMTSFLSGISSLYLVIMVAYLVLRLIFLDRFWWIALPNAFAIYTFAPVFLFLPLLILTRLWRQVIRLGMLALLAVIWFGPFFQPPSPNKPSEGKALTIATFNVWGDNERADDVIDWLIDTNADLVLMQEIPLEFVDELILESRYPYQTELDDRKQWGRMVLSRYPILNYDVSRTHTDRFMLDLDDNGLIVVYNVHMPMPQRSNTPDYGDTVSGWLNLLLKYGEESRNAEIDDLLAGLETETFPYIVAGDFNLSQHSIKYSALSVEMTDSFRATEAGLGATWPVMNFPQPLLRLDYIWLHDDAFIALNQSCWPRFG